MINKLIAAGEVTKDAKHLAIVEKGKRRFYSTSGRMF